MSAIVGRVGEFQHNGTRHPVYVNINTLSRFNSLTNGDDFWSLLSLFEKLGPEMEQLRVMESASEQEQERADRRQTLLILNRLGTPRLLALASAALHTYDANQEPVYRISPGKLGAMIEFRQWMELMPMLLTGLQQFMAGPEDMPRYVAEEPDEPRPTKAAENQTTIAGGPPPTPSDADILGSLTHSSDEALGEQSA